jgi:nucleoside-diphosphate-sugar epimerase
MRIIITGVTGFLGSNIAKGLIKEGNTIFATHRSSSTFEKCVPFISEINWINIDENDWKDQFRAIKADQLIHAAWDGIGIDKRNNWEMQLKNFYLSKEYFDLAKESGIRKVIAIGSQAEYGSNDFSVNENTPERPNDAYGAVKTLTANYLRNLFERTLTQWYWIRVFSIFGEGENPDWLFPYVISNLLKNKAVKLTLCEQKYNYLYIDDFLNHLFPIVQSNVNKSGIYNICDDESITISKILEQVSDLMDVPRKLLQFGFLPYRHGQNMMIDGDNSKIKNTFSIDSQSFTGITNGLIKTIEYYKKLN